MAQDHMPSIVKRGHLPPQKTETLNARHLGTVVTRFVRDLPLVCVCVCVPNILLVLCHLMQQVLPSDIWLPLPPIHWSVLTLCCPCSTSQAIKSKAGSLMCLLSMRCQELALLQEDVEELGGVLIGGELQGNTQQLQQWQEQLSDSHASKGGMVRPQWVGNRMW